MAQIKPAETGRELALYERDFFRWTELMSARLTERNAAGLDWDHLREEIEALGINHRRELKSRLRVLIAHLLKWQYQPELRDGSSWKSTIMEQRDQILDLLESSPSLMAHVSKDWPKVYLRAATFAASEMNMEQTSLPVSCPYSQEQVLDPEFYPE